MPDQAVVAGAQQPVETEAELGRLDLAGVGAADRGQRVGVKDAVAQKIEMPRREVEPARVGCQPEIDQPAAVDHPLEAHVVDRQHRPRALEQAVPLEESLAIERRQRGVPVVAVEDVGRPAHPLRALEGRAR